MKIFRFWLGGAQITLVDAWAAKDAAIRRAYWGGRTPAELIDYDRYRKLPAARRQAIEQHYQQAA